MAMTSQSSAHDPFTYLSRGRFHRCISCARTSSRVSFALVGDWETRAKTGEDADLIKSDLPQRSRLTLYVPASGCSRWMGIILDAVARQRGVCMVVPDRPGVGATPPVPSHSRMRTSTLQTLSMLEALGVEQVDLFTHSGGWLYMLDLLRTRPELIIPSPSGRASNLTLCSPFVPTHLSSSSLGLLPASLVRMTPSAANLLGSCEKAISWSAGVGQNVKSMWGSKETPERLHASKRDQLKRAAREREKSKRTHPNATFHPPYTTHLHLELDAAVVAEHSLAGGSSRKPQSGSKLLFECYKAESGIETTTQEFLFCLGKTSGMNNAELETWLSANLRELARLLRSRTKRCSDTPDGGAPTAAPRLLLVWADQDFMTPQRGRDHLDDLLQRTGLAEACSSTHRWIAAGAGHDDPPGSLDIMRGVFAFSKGESEILALRAAQTSAQAECFAAHKGAPDERSACAS